MVEELKNIHISSRHGLAIQMLVMQHIKVGLFPT